MIGFIRPAPGMPRVSTLSAAVAYATAREGADSVVALVGPGGLVTALRNRGSSESPDVERLVPWDWAAAAGGDLAVSDVFDVVSGSPSLDATDGLIIPGGCTLLELDTTPVRYGYISRSMRIKHYTRTAAAGQYFFMILADYPLGEDRGSAYLRGASSDSVVRISGAYPYTFGTTIVPASAPLPTALLVTATGTSGAPYDRGLAVGADMAGSVALINALAAQDYYYPGGTARIRIGVQQAGSEDMELAVASID